MKKLGPDFFLDEKFLDNKIENIEGLERHRELSKEEIRDKLSDSGRKIKKYQPGKINKEVRILTTDASIIKRELRFHALWASHVVLVYAICDGKQYPDAMIGEEKIPYKKLLYETDIDLGGLIPYSDIEERVNSIRMSKESDILLKNYKLHDKLDHIILDGSLYTNLKNLEGKSGYPENKEASTLFKRLLEDRVVGMVEDSHATDMSRSLDYNITNMMLADIALNPLEYIVDVRNGINICYIKLPKKKMKSMLDGSTESMTVRWEFNYESFHDDIETLSGIWMMEEDLLHPQLYPTRISDYLTRRLKVSGIIDEIISKKGLKLRYRNLREGIY